MDNYTPQTWADGQAGGTPLSAGRMTHIEAGIDAVDAALQALATVARTGAYNDLSGKPTIPAAYTDEQVRDVIGAALVAGTNVTITVNDAGDTITIAAAAPAPTLATIPAGSTITVQKDATTGWPARPTARADVVVAWKGADPAPPGLLAGVDYRIVETVDTSGRPSGSGYVRYEDLYVTGNTFQQVLNKITNGDVLTLPEGTFSFSDFANGYYEGFRVPTTCGGIWGSGRNTIFQMTPNTSTKGSDVAAVPPSSGTNQCYLMGTWHSNTVFRNFQVLGTPQGHSYNAIRVAGASGAVLTGILCQDVYFNGCWPGYANYPPGETFGFGLNWTDGAQLINCEFDGRDPSSRVKSCASPFGWNNSSNAYVSGTYAHHCKTGMPTFYKTAGVHTVSLRAEYNGSGSGVLSSAGINHEDCTGVILHESPSIIIDRATGNSGLHVTVNSGVGNNTTVSLTNISHDAGPNGGCFSVEIDDNYVDPDGHAQAQTSLPTVTKGGVTLTGRDGNAGTANPDPATQFFRYH